VLLLIPAPLRALGAAYTAGISPYATKEGIQLGKAFANVAEPTAETVFNPVINRVLASEVNRILFRKKKNDKD